MAALASCREVHPPTYAITGTVSGVVRANVRITLGGASVATATTDATGGYRFADLAPGNYRVTPHRRGYAFSPPSSDVNLGRANGSAGDFAAVGTLSTLAGVPSGQGYVDGNGADARFFRASDVAVDVVGNLYVADYRAIRRMTPSGVVSTIAGAPGQPGALDGTGSDARLAPWGLDVDAEGNIYVADTSCAVRKISPDGVVSTVAGTLRECGYVDGTGAEARFQNVLDVAVGADGTMFIADFGNCAIRKATPAGVVTTLAGSLWSCDSVDGVGSEARFFSPHRLALDRAGNLYVLEHSYAIRKVTPDGVVTTLAGVAGEPGSADGVGSDARFSFIGLSSGIGVDVAGNVYVADLGAVRSVTPQGLVTTLAGVVGQLGYVNGVGATARFRGPLGLAVDQAGNVYVIDDLHEGPTGIVIRKIEPNGTVTTLSGKPSGYGSADGVSADARFSTPVGIAVDGTGTAYVLETAMARIRRLSPDGRVTTLAEENGLDHPVSIAVDPSGNLYVADRFTIRRITPAGDITTIAGSAGQEGSADGTGPMARFSWAGGVAVDGSGNVYVADAGNHTIRRVSPEAVVTTLAGKAGQSGATDGAGGEARFKSPTGLTFDRNGNLLVSEGSNATIRMVTLEGVVSTIAGAPGQHGNTDGPSRDARFAYPYGLAVDRLGNVYVADFGNNAIRRITPDGRVSTVVGVSDRMSNVMGPLPASLVQPWGVAVDPTTGNLLIVLGNAVLEAGLGDL